MKGAVPSFQAHSCCSDGKLSNGAKIAAIYLVFTIRMERSRKQFSTLCGPVKLVQACLYAGNDRESSFHHCGGPVKFV